MTIVTTESRGFQERVDWMGTSVLTLAELWPIGTPRAMIVGLNPAPKSAEAGHYYQGKSGQTQLRRLVRAGLFTAPPETAVFEESALSAGVGFADLVRRPTVGEEGVSDSELEYGKSQLVRKLESRAVPMVICVFRHPVTALLGSPGKAGFQFDRTSWGAEVFRMPSPYEKRELAASTMQALSERFGA
jgi:double-stranded uracil-DNA glycosylase